MGPPRKAARQRRSGRGGPRGLWRPAASGICSVSRGCRLPSPIRALPRARKGTSRSCERCRLWHASGDEYVPDAHPAGFVGSHEEACQQEENSMSAIRIGKADLAGRFGTALVAALFASYGIVYAQSDNQKEKNKSTPPPAKSAPAPRQSTICVLVLKLTLNELQCQAIRWVRIGACGSRRLTVASKPSRLRRRITGRNGPSSTKPRRASNKSCEL